jgi:hypothetical protein
MFSYLRVCAPEKAHFAKYTAAETFLKREKCWIQPVKTREHHLNNAFHLFFLFHAHSSLKGWDLQQEYGMEILQENIMEYFDVKPQPNQ